MAKVLKLDEKERETLLRALENLNERNYVINRLIYRLTSAPRQRKKKEDLE